MKIKGTPVSQTADYIENLRRVFNFKPKLICANSHATSGNCRLKSTFFKEQEIERDRFEHGQLLAMTSNAPVNHLNPAHIYGAVRIYGVAWDYGPARIYGAAWIYMAARTSANLTVG